MATITAGDFRNGVTFEYDNDVCQVIEFQHVKPGKGAAFVRTKYKKIMTGAIREESFNPTAKFEAATVDRMTMEYSYNDGNLYYFMNPETYELEPVDASVLSDNFKFVKENMECTIYSYKGKVFNVEPPFFVELEVTETDPGFAGNTATNATKPATVPNSPKSGAAEITMSSQNMPRSRRVISSWAKALRASGSGLEVLK